MDYFSPLEPATGERQDKYLRPELSRGTVEYTSLPPPYFQRPASPLSMTIIKY